MDAFETLLGAAAGYFGAQQQAKAERDLAALNLQSAQAAATKAQADAENTKAAAAQWLPGVSNTAVAIGAGVLLLTVAGLVIATRK